MGSSVVTRSCRALGAEKLPITPSIERDQKLWEDKINPQVWIRGFLDEPTKLNQSSLSSEMPLSFLIGNNTPSKERPGRDYSL